MGLSLRGSTSGAIDINAPAVAGDNAITLPTSNGSANQFFKNSGTAGIVTYSSMVEKSGKIGIGTDNPSNKLSITGITSVTGSIAVNGENYPTSGSLSNRNKVINGAMNIAQRSTTAVSATGYQTVDRFMVGSSGGSISQEQHALSSGDTGPWAKGFREAFRLTNTGSATGPTAYREIDYVMEAQDVATMGWDYTNTNSFVTLSFWVKASVTQTYYQSLVSQDGTAYMRSHPLALTAGVWKYFEIAIPGDSNLQFDMNNGAGLRIRFVPFYGINYTGSVDDDTWRDASGPDYLPNMTNTWAGTTDSTFDVTGVQFELGSKATPFEFRSTGDELARCQRYCYRVVGNSADETALGTGQCRDNDTVQGYIALPVTMRAEGQTVTENNMSVIVGNTVTNVSMSASFDEGVNCVGMQLDADSGTPFTAGNGAMVRLNNSESCFFQVTSELT